MDFTSIFQNKNILITGGLGFIGSNLAARLRHWLKPTANMVRSPLCGFALHTGVGFYPMLEESN